MKKRLFGQGLLMLALLGLCGQGACSRYYLAAASTGSYMNAEQGGAPTAVRLYMYQLLRLPPSLPAATCSELQGKTPSALVDVLTPEAKVVQKSIFPGFENGPERATLSDKLSKGTKWVLAVPAFYECRNDKPRWIAFKLDRVSGTTELAFQLQGYSIRPHASMREMSCTNVDPQKCARVGR